MRRFLTILAALAIFGLIGAGLVLDCAERGPLMPSSPSKDEN